MCLITRKPLTASKFRLDLGGNILVALVVCGLGIVIHVCERLWVGESALESLATHRNECGTKIREGVVRTTTPDDVSGSPKLPSVGSVFALGEVRME